MGRSSASVDQPASCRVLPIIDEEEEPADQSGSEISEGAAAAPESRKQAVVARMRELLRRAAADQLSAQSSSLRSSTLATAKKWKRAVNFRINSRRDDGAGARKLEQRLVHVARMSSSSSVSSNNSFSSWEDAVAASADTLLSPARSPPSVLAPSSSEELVEAMSSKNITAQWITTDSDFVVLEL